MNLIKQEVINMVENIFRRYKQWNKLKNLWDEIVYQLEDFYYLAKNGNSHAKQNSRYKGHLIQAYW